jgi:hypothetical protein
MSTDDAFEPYWLDETDWLVTLCVMLEDEDDLIALNWIGRLFGFAQATNTGMLALVGDPDVPAYEILFSFDTSENQREFLGISAQGRICRSR